MPTNWSHYQHAIFTAIRDTSDSLLIEAVAGSGKSTTLVEAVKYVPAHQSVCFLAFNKRIAEELKKRVIAPNATCLTLHAAGWAAWRAHLAWDAGDCKVDQHKTRGILDDEAVFSRRERWAIGGQTARLVGYAKQHGIVPRSMELDDSWTSGQMEAMCKWEGLVPDEDDTWDGLIEHYGLIREECNVDAARKILRESLRRSRAVVDYDDMLYLPVVGGVGFQRYDVVFVDEAQDVSGIQFEMIARMVGETGRVIACGDKFQSIYGFRGAMSNSMQLLAERFGCRPLPLSISYRCPKSVVLHAQRWVKHLEYAEGAADGVVLGPMESAKDWEGQAAIALGSPLPIMDLEPDLYIEGDLSGQKCLCTHWIEQHDWSDQGIGRCQAEHCGCLSYAPQGGNDGVTREANSEGVPQEVRSASTRGRGSESNSQVTEVLSQSGAMEGGTQDYGTGALRTRQRAGDMGSTGAMEGVTKWLPHYESFAPGDAILCRVNRPLAALAFRLIRARVPCKLLGRDIGAGLVALVKRLMKNAQTNTIHELLDNMEAYRQREGKRLLAKKDDAGLATLYDKLDTVMVFLEEADSVAELIREIEGMFGEDAGGGVVLCTVHKAKGLQWPRVFILDADQYMPGPWARLGWEMESERNLQYVAATRTMRELRYIRSSELSGELRRRDDA